MTAVPRFIQETTGDRADAGWDSIELQKAFVEIGWMTRQPDELGSVGMTAPLGGSWIV
jgi:hypothetical protein